MVSQKYKKKNYKIKLNTKISAMTIASKLWNFCKFLGSFSLEMVKNTGKSFRVHHQCEQMVLLLGKTFSRQEAKCCEKKTLEKFGLEPCGIDSPNWSEALRFINSANLQSTQPNAIHNCSSAAVSSLQLPLVLLRMFKQLDIVDQLISPGRLRS